MENPEGVLNLLDDFAKLKSKEIPNDLEEYLSYVAASGDPVYQWSLIKSLYRQKLINVITEFYEMCPVVDIPHCPNVDPFNYETMKNSLLKRLDSFSSAPFTIQRISELLTAPRKQYNRVDKFMRAIEKNIWVVSTREPGTREQSNSQETANLVNGVTPRVCVTVKHPKRVKSIEERIKSGHPQLIDDDEEDEEEEELDEYEQMEEDNTTEILPNSEADDTSLQCTSVKDLIEKYENGTIFSNSEEKTDFEEKTGQLDKAAIASSSPKVSSVAPDATKTITPAISSEMPSDSETPSQSATEFSSSESSSEKQQEQEQEQEPEPVSTEDSMSLIVQCDTEKELIEPVVAADSSSDLACNEKENKNINLEAPALDSTTDIPFEDPQTTAESSILKTDMPETVEDSLAMIVDPQPETSSLDLTSEVSASNEEFQTSMEPSIDSFSECETKEADVVEKNNECL